MQIGEPTAFMKNASPPPLTLEVKLFLWGFPIRDADVTLEFADGDREQRQLTDGLLSLDCSRRVLTRVHL